MPDATEESLHIRCPSCKQRFSVDGQLINRIVECGACTARFRITDEVILRTKKFYPGERPHTDLSHFQRVPLPSPAPKGLQTIRYAEFKHNDLLEPTSPQRIIGGIFGVALMVLLAFLFIFSNGPGATFGIMTLTNKLIIAGFFSMLGLALLINANPKARTKAAFFGTILSAGLISLPFLFKGTILKENPQVLPKNTNPVATIISSETKKEDAVDTLKQRFSIKPLETEQLRLKNAGSNRKAYGIYLTNLLQRNIYTVRDYLIRDTMADPSSHPFPRDHGDYLMVLSEVSMDISQVAEIAGRLGELVEIHSEIGVVVIKVNNDHFKDGSADKLNDTSDPAFYHLNRRELESLDLARVKRAVIRLGSAEPKVYRTDISKLLIALMTRPGVRFHDEIAKALIVWSEDAEEAGEVTLKVLQDHLAAGDPVSENIVALLAEGKVKDAIPSVHGLWMGNPMLWSSHYEKFGSDIELNLIENLDSAMPEQLHSAIKILDKVGTESSLPALRKLLDSQDPEVRVLAERAIAKISER